MPENQAYWTQRWADQMNFRYWKERCAGGNDDQRRDGAAALLRGDRAYKTGDFPTAADKFKEGLELWKTRHGRFPTYRDDELNKKDTGHIVKRYRAGAQATSDARSPTICRSRIICRSSRTTTRSTRSTRSR